MKKILFLTFAFCLLPFYFSHAATVYVAPPPPVSNGSDSSGNGTSSAPWATIQFATRSAQAPEGTTIIVRNGTYNEAVSINCASGSNNGTAGAQITIQAENERMAAIINNSNSTISIRGCAYWNIIGMRLQRTKLSDGGVCPGYPCHTLSLDSYGGPRNSNITVRRNLILNNHCEPYPGAWNCSTHLLYVDFSDNITIEENELGNFTHHALNTRRSTGLIVRRNYCNSGALNGSGCYTMYPSQNAWIENNISEDASFAELNANGDPLADNNRYNGNISFGGTFTLTARNSQNEGCAPTSCPPNVLYTPTNNILTNHICIGCGTSISARSARNTQCNNCSFFNTSLAWDVRYTPGNDEVGDNAPSFFSTNSLLYNSGYTVSDTRVLASDAAWEISFGQMVGSGSYSPGLTNANVTNEITAGYTGMGRCYLYVEGPQSFNPGFGSGSSGANRGATVLYETVAGVTSSTRNLWDFTQTGTRRGEAKKAINGGWAGAVIAGVNDGTNPDFPRTLSNVQQRLQFGTGPCPTPGGGAPLLPTVTITNNGGKGAGVDYTTSSQALTLTGTATGTGF